jgi:murein DD-endopeptidase MepM/ murein hydrolase activator NlpD
MLRARLLPFLAVAALAAAPAASASAADLSGGAFDTSGSVYGSSVDGGVSPQALTPKPKPKPRPRPRPRPRAKPKPKPRPKPKPAPRRVVRSGVFPVRGTHSFGGADLRFGAPRTGHRHQGQDVIAAEGTLLESPVNGTVYYRAYQASGAGNYVVIRGTDRRYYVLMHLQRATPVRVGSSVRAGQPVGRVGHTGDAQGPHLHFEVWVGGWYSGGHPVDPLPFLRRWR